jgi:hypothetical protein
MRWTNNKLATIPHGIFVGIIEALQCNDCIFFLFFLFFVFFVLNHTIKKGTGVISCLVDDWNEDLIDYIIAYIAFFFHERTWVHFVTSSNKQARRVLHLFKLIHQTHAIMINKNGEREILKLKGETANSCSLSDNTRFTVGAAVATSPDLIIGVRTEPMTYAVDDWEEINCPVLILYPQQEKLPLLLSRYTDVISLYVDRRNPVETMSLYSKRDAS